MEMVIKHCKKNDKKGARNNLYYVNICGYMCNNITCIDICVYCWMNTTLYNGMILSTLNIKSHNFAWASQKASHQWRDPQFCFSFPKDLTSIINP